MSSIYMKLKYFIALEIALLLLKNPRICICVHCVLVISLPTLYSQLGYFFKLLSLWCSSKAVVVDFFFLCIIDGGVVALCIVSVAWIIESGKVGQEQRLWTLLQDLFEQHITHLQTNHYLSSYVTLDKQSANYVD